MNHWMSHVCGTAVILTVAWMMTEPVKAETELDGTWLATDATVSGEPASQIVGHRLDFEGDRFRITKYGTPLYGGSFSVDSTASPPAIQFEQTETDTLAGTWLGIYELDADTLAICDNAPDMTKPRPSSFADCTGQGYVSVRFTR
jgi:uncharacterized protein (TIGR03067 family)